MVMKTLAKTIKNKWSHNLKVDYIFAKFELSYNKLYVLERFVWFFPVKHIEPSITFEIYFDHGVCKLKLHCS